MGAVGGRGGLAAPVEQPPSQAGQAESVLACGDRQHLADVLEVGESTSTALVAQQSLDHGGVGGEGLDHAGGAALALQVGEVAQPGGDAVGEGVAVVGRELGGREAEERSERGGAGVAAAVRRLHGGQQRDPVLARPALQHVRATGAHGGHAAPLQLGVQQLGVAVPLDEHGDVAGRQRHGSGAVVVGGAAPQERGDVGGDVARDPRPDVADAQGVVVGAGVAAQVGPQPEGGVAAGVVEP